MWTWLYRFTRKEVRLSGADWEQRALLFLQQHKLHLLVRNYRCKTGEIDLIMRAPDATLIFIEVRARTHHHFGGAAASVDKFKQQRLLRTAAHYLQRWSPIPACRFDVIAFENGQLKWYQNAFSVDLIQD